MERFTLTELYQAQLCMLLFCLQFNTATDTIFRYLDNPLSHQIQNTVKLTLYLQFHTTTTTDLITQVSIRATCFC